jgi:uncharacterized protein (DUF1778 family)
MGPPHKPKRHAIHVRLSPDDYQLLQQAARLDERPTADAIRRAIRLYARSLTGETPANQVAPTQAVG